MPGGREFGCAGGGAVDAEKVRGKVLLSRGCFNEWLNIPNDLQGDNVREVLVLSQMTADMELARG